MADSDQVFHGETTGSSPQEIVQLPLTHPEFQFFIDCFALYLSVDRGHLSDTLMLRYKMSYSTLGRSPELQNILIEKLNKITMAIVSADNILEI